MLPVVNRVSGSAFERDEQLAIAMFEVAGVEAYKRLESRRAQFLATGDPR